MSDDIRILRIDEKVISAVQSLVADYRERNPKPPETLITSRGALPGDTASMFGMSVHIIPEVPPGTIIVSTREYLEELEQAIAAFRVAP